MSDAVDVYDVERIVRDEVSPLRYRVNELEGKVARLERELGEDIRNTRSDMEDAVRGLRNEVAGALIDGGSLA